jgi:hypothetical protein
VPVSPARRLDLLIRAGLVLYLLSAFVGLLRGLVGSLLGGVFGGVPGFLGSTLHAMAGIFGRIFGAVASIFHVLFKAGIGAGLRDDGKPNGQNARDEGGAEEFGFHRCSHTKKDSEMSDGVVAGDGISGGVSEHRIP